MKDLQYLIALSLVPNIGSRRAKELVNYFGSAQEVFLQKEHSLKQLHGYGDVLIRNIGQKKYLEKAEKEIEFILKNNIKFVEYSDSNFPFRLKRCPDSPVVLYFKGAFDFNPAKVISFVGTRKATQYGLDSCKRIIEEIVQLGYDFTVVSGFALGIDTAAHLAALEYNQQTIACLAHGLNTVYPPQNRKYVESILAQGGLVTEFRHSESFHRKNFIARNRIIAGMSDCSIVVETGVKGGALITAEFANSYSREVCALPGRANDTSFVGCNNLIKQHKASLITSGEDVVQLLNWDLPQSNPPRKKLLLLSEREQKVIDILGATKLSFDELLRETQFNYSNLSKLLFEMEMEGYINFLPGNFYERS